MGRGRSPHLKTSERGPETLLEFLSRRKGYWLLPMLSVVLVVLLLLLLTRGSPEAFVYTLF